MIARYWWGKSGRKGIHWLGWRKLCKPKCLGGLGFKNFEAFNKAMVAKQAWRILEKPTSLVVKILKARYFPHDDFMQASLGSSSSMIWKSILWGREVIEDGLIWRVGNGASIRVFQDRWIPKPFTFKPLTDRGLDWNTTISDLLTASGSWNLPLLEQHFSLEDRDIIFGIALGLVSQLGDSKFWFFSKNRKYSVNTRYRVAVRQCDEDFGVGGSNQSAQEGFWMRIWKLAVPNKIKMLIWRACTDILPTTVNLSKRRVLTSHVCSRCGKYPEDAYHALWSSKMSQIFWKCTYFI
ncbi:unnamed protein product [Prunus armeniaca]